MLPYRPENITHSKPPKVKSLPSLELTNMITEICQNTKNSFDSKKYVLTVNDCENFESCLREKYGRSVRSFEKQLKMLGFKSKKYKEVNQELNKKEGKAEFYEVKIYKWKGKKQILVNQELSYFQKNLNDRKHDMKAVRERVRESRKYIDSYLQSIMLSLMVEPSSVEAKTALKGLVNQTREIVNSSEVEMREILNKMSNTLGNQLQLYRLLIFKEQNQKKKETTNNSESNFDQQENNQESGNQVNQGTYNQGKENGVPNVIPEQQNSDMQVESEDSKSQVSIKMDDAEPSESVEQERENKNA